MKKLQSLGVVSLGLLVGLSAACGKKKSSASDGTPAVEAKITDAENSVVTSDTTALQLSSALVLLPAKDSAATALTDDESTRVVSIALAEGSGKKLQLRVANDAFEGVESISSIMCYFSQTQFWKEAGKGEYKVLVDQSKCEESKSSGDEGGSSQEQSYMTAFVKSERPDNKPLTADIRFIAKEGSEGKNVEYHARIVVAAAPSKEDPAGVFTMYFTARQAGKSGGGGFIRAKRGEAGKFVLEMAEESKAGEVSNQYVIAELEKSGADFIGRVASKSDSSGNGGGGTYSRKSEYKIRFDVNHVNVDGAKKETQGGRDQESVQKGCYGRNTFKTSIHRYDLVDAAGQIKTLKSGFPIEIEKGGKTLQGNASYWGIWTPGKVSVETGDAIYKVQWKKGGGKERTKYSVIQADGKLVKYTRSEVKLSTLKGVDVSFNESGSNFNVQWNGTAFVKISKQTRSDDGQMGEEAASGTVSVPQWGLNFFVPSLNANVRIPGSATLSDDLTVAYHSQEVVSGSAKSLGNLVCFSNCPVVTPTAAAFVRSSSSGQTGPASSDLYIKQNVTFSYGQGQTQTVASNQGRSIATPWATYTWNETTKLLAMGGVDFSLPADLSSSSDGSNKTDNVRSGALVSQAVYDALADKAIDPYKLENQLTEYYRWEAGPSQWNQYMAIVNEAGQIESFDKPLQFAYTHTTANDWDGQTDAAIVARNYRLNYGGPGQLWGVPMKYNKDIGRQIPLFSIKSGTKLGDYTVLALSGDQRMVKAEDAKCTALGLESMPGLPKAEAKDIDNSALGATDVALRYQGGDAIE